MMNNLYLILGASWFLDIYFYGMQRYIQLISREVGIEFKLGKLLMLPIFYGVTYILSLLKYGLAIYLMIYHDWISVLYVVLPIFLVSLFIPIPYKFLYRNLINNTLSNKMNSFPEHIATIVKIQIGSRLLS